MSALVCSSAVIAVVSCLFEVEDRDDCADIVELSFLVVT